SALIIGGSVALVVLIIVSALLVITMIRRRSAQSPTPTIVVTVDESSVQRKPSVANTQASFYSTSTRKVDPFEVERSCIAVDLQRPLGQGAFGSVFMGNLSRQSPSDWNGVVAVKMLKASKNANQDEFYREIRTMKAIGYHERIANILACVTSSLPSILVLEYCANGDLLSYLRKRLHYMLENSGRGSVDPRFMITQRQQLTFAEQVAQGLEFLSSRGFVHRDLAARNILVDGAETCKIADFGLCREIGKGPEHYQSKGGRLPIKWMSPEAIEYSQFSTASDVWSYGVVLFEILTLGGSPYPRWHVSEVLGRLKSGERMRRPECCTDQMFTLMQHCWLQQPGMRPTFKDIRRFLTQQMNQPMADSYFAIVNGQADYYIVTTTSDLY
ncbi:hypothetical protein PFISCL1PPCAC_18730, partial [Pristionchus fissidentatus]